MSRLAALHMTAPEGVPAEGGQWVHLVPSGTFRGKDGRGPYDASNATAIIAASLAAAAGRPIPIDYDHQIDLAAPNGGQAPAAGWVGQLEARRDGVWGLAEWTPRARNALQQREYRYLSPVIQHTPEGAVTLLLRASLTNNPNLTQLTALNSAGRTMDPKLGNSDLLAELRELLGLPADADEASVVATVKRLVTSANTADPAKFVPMALFQQAVAEANKANVGVSRQAAEIEVDNAIRDRKLMGFARDWAIGLCMANRPAFDEFITKTGGQVAAFFHTIGTPDPSMEAAARRQSPAGVAASSVQAALGLSADDVKKYGAPRA